jgi:hypothetical protein
VLSGGTALSAREMEVLKLITARKSNQEIAATNFQGSPLSFGVNSGSHETPATPPMLLQDT